MPPHPIDSHPVIGVNDETAAILPYLLRESGISAPRLIDKFDLAVGAVTRRQRRNRIDRRPQCFFRPARPVLGELSLGILAAQRFIGVFELQQSDLLLIAHPLQRVGRPALRRAQRHHKQCTNGEHKQLRNILQRQRKGIERRQEEVIESQNGEHGGNNARSGAAEPRHKHDCAGKQRGRWRKAGYAMKHQAADHCISNRHDRNRIVERHPPPASPQYSGRLHLLSLSRTCRAPRYGATPSIEDASVSESKGAILSEPEGVGGNARINDSISNICAAGIALIATETQPLFSSRPRVT